MDTIVELYERRQNDGVTKRERNIMLLLVVTAGLAGALLGLKVNLMAFILALLMGLTLVIAVGAVTGAQLPFVFFDALLFSVSLQLGYLGGVALKFCNFF